jgi:valyl-tRNA synthetase
VTTLESLLRALHPMMPFITEEIWQRVHPLVAPLLAALNPRAAHVKQPDSIMTTFYPAASDYARDQDAESLVGTIKEYILKVRQIRGEMNIAPSRKIALLLRDPDAAANAMVAEHAHYLQRLAGLEKLEVLAAGESGPVSASAMVMNTTLLVPLAGLIDPVAEVDRLSKVIAKNESDLAKLNAKLGNANFVKNAKPELVAADQARVAELTAHNQNLAVQLERVRKLT